MTLSVIVPFLNEVPYLERCIRSLRRQMIDRSAGQDEGSRQEIIGLSAGSEKPEMRFDDPFPVFSRD
jgi:glycosyltransferase involved in cell wall biosynthesis